MSTVEEAKELICDLCRNLYDGGHVSGTGGGISIRVGDKVVMAPSGVQKERMRPEDMFVLDAQGEVLHMPTARPPPYKPPKLSECQPLFMAVRMCASVWCVVSGVWGRYFCIDDGRCIPSLTAYSQLSSSPSLHPPHNTHRTHTLTRARMDAHTHTDMHACMHACRRMSCATLALSSTATA